MAEKSYDGGDLCAAIALGIVAGAIVMVPITLMVDGTTANGVTKAREEAIQAGSGEWRADPKTGAVEFVWLKRD